MGGDAFNTGTECAQLCHVCPQRRGHNRGAGVHTGWLLGPAEDLLSRKATRPVSLLARLSLTIPAMSGSDANVKVGIGCIHIYMTTRNERRGRSSWQKPGS